MKSKLILILAVLLIPFSGMAVQTNVFDNALIRNNLQFTGATIGSGKVLTSDAVGYYTPQSILSLGAFAVTNGGNLFLFSSTNRFLAPVTVSNVVALESIRLGAVGGTTNITRSISGVDLRDIITPGAGGTYFMTIFGEQQFTMDNTSITLGNNSADNILITGTLNSLNIATFVTNNAPSADSVVTWTGQGTHTLTPALNYAIVVTNNSSPTFTLINSMTPANFITNITSATATITSQGTHTLNIEVAASSGNPFSAITNNGTTVLNGSLFIKRVTTATNYTSGIGDCMVSFRGTTATQVTNFLPAISTTFTNGFYLTVKDGQSSAAVTNIVVFPSGTDTIGNTTNYYINANKGSIDIVVDAVNKNWELK